MADKPNEPGRFPSFCIMLYLIAKLIILEKNSEAYLVVQPPDRIEYFLFLTTPKQAPAEAFLAPSLVVK
jgi:hypothetical protein